MLPHAENVFKLFCIKPHFKIDKSELKQKYFELSKANHPDISGNIERQKEINQAYQLLNNDLSRARLLTKNKIKDQGTIFLSDVLEFEEQIDCISNNKEIETIKNDLNNLINNCKKNVSDINSISKWIYYERLLKKLREKEIKLELGGI